MCFNEKKPLFYKIIYMFHVFGYFQWNSSSVLWSIQFLLCSWMFNLKEVQTFFSQTVLLLLLLYSRYFFCWIWYLLAIGINFPPCNVYTWVFFFCDQNYCYVLLFMKTQNSNKTEIFEASLIIQLTLFLLYFHFTSKLDFVFVQNGQPFQHVNNI